LEWAIFELKGISMSDVSRFGVSMDSRLLEQFDEKIYQKGYSNRSEAMRDLVRNALIDDLWTREDEPVVGTVTIVFDHHTRELAAKLTEHQHAHTDAIVSTLHVHLDAHYCLEVVVVKGLAKVVRKIADELIGTRGVIHGKLVCTSTGQQII
jgi:CopG family nickel-responsive transcriptional regulator